MNGHRCPNCGHYRTRVIGQKILGGIKVIKGGEGKRYEIEEPAVMRTQGKGENPS